MGLKLFQGRKYEIIGFFEKASKRPGHRIPKQPGALALGCIPPKGLRRERILNPIDYQFVTIDSRTIELFCTTLKQLFSVFVFLRCDIEPILKISDLMQKVVAFLAFFTP